MKKFLAILTVMTMVMTTLVVPTVAFAEPSVDEETANQYIKEYEDECKKFFDDVLEDKDNDGKKESLTVNSVEPSRQEDMDIIFASLSQKAPSPLYLEWYTVNEGDFSEIEFVLVHRVDITDDETGEECTVSVPIDSKNVHVYYDSDSKIKDKVNSFIEKIDIDNSEFTVSDMELINYWYNISQAEDEFSMENTLINYSSKFKDAIDTYNFYISIGAGDLPSYYSFEEGSVALIYKDTFYGVIPRVAARGEHVIYVAKETEYDDLAATAEARIKKYLGSAVYDASNIQITENNGETVENAYENLIDSFIAFQNETLDNINEDKERVEGWYKNGDIGYDEYNEEITRINEELDWWENVGIPESVENYKAKIKFIKDICDSYHDLPTFTLSINGLKQNIIILPEGELEDPSLITKDLATDVEISTGSSEVPLDSLIEAEKKDDIEEVLKEEKGVTEENSLTYDLKVYSKTLAHAKSNSKNGYITELANGEFEVVIPIKDTSLEGKTLVAYYVYTDGPGNSGNEVIEEHEVTVEKGYAKFTTTHFSTYTLAPVSDTDTSTPGASSGSSGGSAGGSITPDSSVNTGDDFSAIPYIAVMAIALAGVAVALFRRKTVK